MKNLTLSLVAGAVFALGMAANIQAQTSPTDSGSKGGDESGLPSFGGLDTDNKGQLGRSDIPKNVEGLRQLRAHFMEYDKDHNGRLSPYEYAAYISTQTPVSQQKPGQKQQ